MSPNFASLFPITAQRKKSLCCAWIIYSIVGLIIGITGSVVNISYGTVGFGSGALFSTLLDLYFIWVVYAFCTELRTGLPYGGAVNAMYYNNNQPAVVPSQMYQPGAYGPPPPYGPEQQSQHYNPQYGAQPATLVDI
jgi:hypothetical protein